MSIYTGFEGYKDPTEADVKALLQSAMIVLDANVLLDLYEYPEPARELALDVLESLSERIWIPHQVMREFWRNRHGALLKVKPPANPLSTVRQELLAIVNKLRPDRERPDDIQEIRAAIETQLTELAGKLEGAIGRPLDIDALLLSTQSDPIIQRLEVIMDRRVGPPFTDDEFAKYVSEGLDRFEKSIPPGYVDGRDKADQVPERGTGDFLFWEQVLREQEARSTRTPFVLVTDDQKEDWRVVVVQQRKRALGVRPELVSECLARTGSTFVLLHKSDLYRLMAELRPSDAETSDTLVEVSAREVVDITELPGGESGWSSTSYAELLSRLRAEGRVAHASVIERAAHLDGFVSREEVYEEAGFDEARSLKRFTLPAKRVAIGLIEDGLLDEGFESPLEAVYEGPGKAVGFRVPAEFSSIAREVSSSGTFTWVDAAAWVAASDPDRGWNITELVGEIERRGLRDFTNARTPEATLRRDLAYRSRGRFEDLGNGQYRLIAPPARPLETPGSSAATRGAR